MVFENSLFNFNWELSTINKTMKNLTEQIMLKVFEHVDEILITYESMFYMLVFKCI